jgi:hypothetical protein
MRIFLKCKIFYLILKILLGIDNYYTYSIELRIIIQ